MNGLKTIKIVTNPETGSRTVYIPACMNKYAARKALKELRKQQKQN
jgi:hypothetical protein